MIGWLVVFNVLSTARQPHLLSLAKNVKLDKYTVLTGNQTPGRRMAVQGKILLNWEKNSALGTGPYFGPMTALEKRLSGHKNQRSNDCPYFAGKGVGGGCRYLNQSRGLLFF